MKEEIKKIDNLLLCVGAQKSGTTWLHAQLQNHPEIGFPPNIKEVHYFNTIHKNSVLLVQRHVARLEQILKNNRPRVVKYFVNLNTGQPVDEEIRKLLSPVDDNWYVNLFTQNRKKYCADFTPEYALLPDAGFEHINHISKNKKIIFIMRDPIARAKSAIRYFFKNQGKKISEVSSEEVARLANADFIIDMSSYHITVEKLEKHFQSEDVLFLFYEDIMEDKQGAINTITNFLNIAAIHISEEQLEQKVNSTGYYDFSNDITEILKSQLKETYIALYSKFNNIPKKWAVID